MLMGEYMSARDIALMNAFPSENMGPGMASTYTEG